MQRCRSNDVSAVRREIMWRRVWPILAHTDVISHALPVAKSSFSLKANARPMGFCDPARECSACGLSHGPRTHRTPKALRAKIIRSQSTSGGELARVSREFPPEEFHLPLPTTDAVAVSLDAVSASVKASPPLESALRSLLP